MATFWSFQRKVRLVRNHEMGEGSDAFAPNIAYDQNAGGGTTTLEFDPRKGRAREELGQHQRHRAQLCRRPDAVGVLAHLRRNDGRTGGRQRSHQEARLHLRSPRVRSRRPRADCRDGPFLPRGSRGRSGHAHRVRNRRRRQHVRLLPLPAQPSAHGQEGRQAADAGHPREARSSTRAPIRTASG